MANFIAAKTAFKFIYLFIYFFFFLLSVILPSSSLRPSVSRQNLERLTGFSEQQYHARGFVSVANAYIFQTLSTLTHGDKVGKSP